ncbi:MAG TPA: hypothetical protein VNO32_50770 [Candidatus Acidoferrum sp.]|nr:hypothetical protein [Candidatus Acidoferrum sp.]
MDLEYDLFEKYPNGAVMWVGMVRGVDSAIARLKELASLSPNEHIAIHTLSKTVVARMNVPKSDQAGFGE